MKLKLLFACSILGTFAGQLQAQTPFATIDSINVGKINASICVHGDMWHNPSASSAACFFPKGTVKSLGLAAGLWISGYDTSSNLHISAQTYRTGVDYWPGPLDNTDTLTFATSQKWAKIWKVYRSEIQHFQFLVSTGTATVDNIPQGILTWPAKGNTHAQGAGGASLTIDSDMAPFIDVNANGIYEPLLGDYPDVRGDEALWWVFSDNGATHSASNGKPLGVEIHAMAYAYGRSTLIDNVVFYNYKVINKSSNTYSNCRISQFADMDLGYFGDDYIGFDSTRGLGITYNGNNNDGGGAGSPANSYGTSIPVAGVKFMGASPGIGIGNFTYYNNDVSVIGNPTSDWQYNNYMRGRLRDSSFFTDDYSGSGTPSKGYGSGPQTQYVFYGDPGVSSEWSECSSNNVAGDRRFVLTTSDFTLSPGGASDITLALMTTNPDTSNGCPGVNFTGIRNIADLAQLVYDEGGLPPLPAGVASVAAGTESVKIYPNPAHDRLYVESAGTLNNQHTIAIYNAIGQLIPASVSNTGQSKDEVNIAGLPQGVYYLQYSAGGARRSISFVIE